MRIILLSFLFRDFERWLENFLVWLLYILCIEELLLNLWFRVGDSGL